MYIYAIACCFLVLLAHPVWLGKLLVVVIHLGVILSIVALYIHGHVGAAHHCVLTISTTEHREVRILVIRIGSPPLISLQKGERSHTFFYLDRCATCYLASEVATTVDIVRIDILALVIE